MVVATACGAPSHTVEQLRFSDNANAKVELHPDTFDEKFEMGHASFVHGHLDISYEPGWWAKHVTASSELPGPPERGPTHRIEVDVPLASGKNRISWPVLFSPGVNGLFKWVEGHYSGRCTTPSGSAAGSFELIDTAAALARTQPMKPLSELLGPGSSGRPFEAPWRTQQPKPLADWSTLLGDRWLADTFSHRHEGLAIPPVATPAPAPSPKPVPDRAPAPALRVTFRATDTRLGDDGPTGERFDTATLKYIVFEVDIPGTITTYSLNGCWLERAATGTRFLAQLSQVLDFKTDRFTLRGGVGIGRERMWLPGEYRLKCEADGISIPESAFVVTGESNGWKDDETVLTYRTSKILFLNGKPEEMRFFEAGPGAPPPAERRYRNSFVAPVRYISNDVGLLLEPRQDAIQFPYRCHYYTTTGKLVGQTRSTYEVPAGRTSVTMTAGWGNASGTFWKPGNYYVECDLAEVFLLGSFFRIDDR
jgi:hypothetical protein